MNEHLKLLIEDLKNLWKRLDINQKFSIAALVVAMLVIGVFFIFKATEPNWTVLYSDLSKDDVASISESLKKGGYAFKISDDRTSVLVRNQDKEDLRMFVAENDLIKDSSGGFELLDSLQLGSTDFKNQLTKQRIFQGELTRSIEKMTAVKKARVQIATPERSIFSDNDEEPSASVVLILNPGATLKASQIMAIKNLVAYSIPRLTQDRVFLTDQYGNALSDDVSKNSSDMQTFRTNFEKEASKKIKDTLETIMGKDNVSVQVSAVMDFNQTRSTIESYTPNKESDAGVILAQQGEREVYSNPKDSANVQNTNQEEANPTNAQINTRNELNQMNTREAQPAVAKNEVALALNQTPSKTVNYDKENENANGEEVKKLSYEKEKSATTYAVTKEIKQVVYAPGSVVRMSVAVAVNKILTDNEKEEIKSLVLAAAGMDTNRGDVVNVSSLKFTGIDKTEEERQNQEQQTALIFEILTFIFKNVAPVLFILILGLIALHNFGNVFRGPKPEDNSMNNDNQEAAPVFDPYLMLQQNQTTTDDFYEPDIQFTSSVDKKKNDIINSVMGNPEEAARVITSYVKD